MYTLSNLLLSDIRRKSKDAFIIGYNIIFPIIMILLLGYLTSGGYGKEFTGYHYYSIVIPPFCIAMAIITAAYAGKDDAYKKTAARLLYAPISSTHIVLSKLGSCTLIISICNFLILLFSMLVLKLPIRYKLMPIALLLTSITFTVCAIGLLIGLGMKNFILIKNVLNIPICIAAILAGCFYPIGSVNPVLQFILSLSPLTWVNRSIFLYLYDDSSALLWRVMLIFILVGSGVAIVAVKAFKKEEFIHGDLPGYDK